MRVRTWCLRDCSASAIACAGVSAVGKVCVSVPMVSCTYLVALEIAERTERAVASRGMQMWKYATACGYHHSALPEVEDLKAAL